MDFKRIMKLHVHHFKKKSFRNACIAVSDAESTDNECLQNR